MRIHIRAAQNKQRGRMRPAGRQFDMPALRSPGKSKVDFLNQGNNTMEHIISSSC